MMRVLRKFADSYQSDSWAVRQRRKRFELFRSLTASLPRPARILDVGGKQQFWEAVGFFDPHDVEVVLLNIKAPPVTRANFRSMVGDARQLPYGDGEFDVTFSNSVIQYMTRPEDLRQMAQELQRVGRRYFVQSPNRRFPMDPMSLLPFFHLMPLGLQARLLSRYSLGWYPRAASREEALQTVTSTRMLSRGELMSLFPGGRLYVERLFGLAKSFTVYGGWNGPTGA
jgi:hypothetical protein